MCPHLFAAARLEVATLPVRHEHGHVAYREALTLFNIAVALRFGRQARAGDIHTARALLSTTVPTPSSLSTSACGAVWRTAPEGRRRIAVPSQYSTGRLLLPCSPGLPTQRPGEVRARTSDQRLIQKRAPNQPLAPPANAICLPRNTAQVGDPVALPASVPHRKSIRLGI